MRKTQNISLQPDEWEKIRKIAVLKNITISQYVRLCIREGWNEKE